MMEQNGWGPPAVDLNFLKSGLGVLKLVQMVLSLTGFIVAEVTASPYNWEQMKAYEWISLTIFILTLAVFTIFLASWHKSEAVVRVNWPLVGFCHSALCTVLWAINFILGVISISWRYRLLREGGAIVCMDFCHSALCTVLWSVNLILALHVARWYEPNMLVAAIVITDFCHSGLCTVLWSINLILALHVAGWYGPGMLVWAIVVTDLCHSALCTVLWSINLILALHSSRWHRPVGLLVTAIVVTDFCHSALCTVLWSINFILGLISIHWHWPRDEPGAIVDMILAIISLLTFWATVRMSYRRWHYFSPTPTIPYHYQHLGTEPYS